MADSVARIRPYKEEDRKLVLFMVGKSNLEQLAVANNRAYIHPVTLAIWMLLSSAFIQYMNWWPSNDYGFMSYLRPLPAFASTAVPLMFFADWINRPYFEELTQGAIRYGDLNDIQSYYSREAASGVWILEYGKVYVGFIAMDATQPSKKDKKQAAGEEKKPKTALIRHFHIDEAFRGSNIQEDLLTYAVDHAFNSDPKLERIEAPDSPLVSYLRPCFRAKGFELHHHTKKVGVFGWNLGMRYLERKTWSAKRK